jgi:SAM-dependent methyltransferase
MHLIRPRSRIREFARTWHARLSDWRAHADRTSGEVVPHLASVAIAGHDEYVEYLKAHEDEYEERRRVSHALIRRTPRIGTRGFCFACQARRTFETPYPSFEQADPGVPDWREGMICPDCSLNGRMRAATHMLQEWLAPAAGSQIYLTEQVTALYRWVKARYPASVGSEFLVDGTGCGNINDSGIRHEDLTALSFDDASIDHIVSLEVLEHVADFRAALRECARVLKPGGKLLLTAPFTRDERHLIRARLRADQTIEHLETPEYHRDPLDPAGCLCFYHFGWELIDDLTNAGFHESACHLLWSREFGYMARKPEMCSFIAER